VVRVAVPSGLRAAAILLLAAAGACRKAPASAFDRWRSVVASGAATVAAPAAIRAAAEEWCGRLGLLGPPRFVLSLDDEEGAFVRIQAGRGLLPRQGPVEVTVDGLRVGREFFRDPADVALVAWDSTGPPFGILAPDPFAVAELLSSLELPGNPCVRVYRGGELEAEWDLTPEGSLREGSERHPGAGLRRFQESPLGPVAGAPGLRFFLAPEDGEARPPLPAALVALLRETLARLEALAGASAERPFEVFVHSHPEDLIEVAGAFRGAWGNPSGRRLHALADGGLRGEAAAELARLAGRSLLGRAAEPWMEIGLAAACSGERLGMPVEEIAARLRRAGAAASLADLRDRRARLSPFRVEASAAALVVGIFAAAGRERFRRFYRGEECPWTDGELESVLEATLERWSRARPVGPRIPIPGGFGQGIHLAGLAGEIDTRGFDWSLERIREAGAGWIALRPSVSLRRAWEGGGLDFDPLERGVSDASSLAWALRRARSLGLRRALGPPFFPAVAGGHWLEGDPHAPSQDAEALSTRGFDAAVHLAVLAEAAGADLLLLGGDWAAPPGLWSRILASCRAIYSGPIAFCPRAWPGEGGPLPPDGLEYLAFRFPGSAEPGENPAAFVRRVAESARGARSLAVLIVEEGFPLPRPGRIGREFLDRARALLHSASMRPEISLLLWRLGPADPSLLAPLFARPVDLLAPRSEDGR
jgi:hypothetical protein